MMRKYSLLYLSFREKEWNIWYTDEKNEIEKMTLERRLEIHSFQENHLCFSFQEKGEIYYFVDSQEISRVKFQNGKIVFAVYSASLLQTYYLYLLYYKSGSSVKTISTHFLKCLLESAVEEKASDIHFEIFEQRARIRYRIDGNLRIVLEIEHGIYSTLVSQIKVFANMNLVEKKLPQDGSFTMQLLTLNIDFRVSTLPSFYGEKIVIRILQRDESRFNIEKLGFSKEQLMLIKKVLSLKSGLVLNCGPTGSGKTTTLYSFLNYKKSQEINILSVEDPVEYHLDGITQVPCREEIGMTYPVILKTFLRQDPDVIMIGEIRDEETANIAVKAALTGHLVISSIHAKDSLQCIERLHNLGIDYFLIANSLQMILSQRLLKTLCPFCKKVMSVATKKNYENYGYEFQETEHTIYEEGSCSFCNQQGYKGRVPIFEVFYCNEENREWILSFPSSSKKPKFDSLRFYAFEKLKKGDVSLKEVLENV